MHASFRNREQVDSETYGWGRVIFLAQRQDFDAYEWKLRDGVPGTGEQ
jgi:hypothetical protein